MGNRVIKCCVHGEQQETFVCQHIIQTLEDGKARGFWWANDPENERPDAWCTECEHMVQITNGEWTEESEAFAKVSLLCGACYDKAKSINGLKAERKPWWKFW
ncbi:hypothetical protein [Vibrio gigantis]|uniref:hypothetical protein n=1 Tax=Vibrio gigantis TaxID=296199 RepID=UPI001BFD09FB|nr:hypothetical protein [Vibrio gigantis]